MLAAPPPAARRPPPAARRPAPGARRPTTKVLEVKPSGGWFAGGKRKKVRQLASQLRADMAAMGGQTLSARDSADLRQMSWVPTWERQYPGVMKQDRDH